VTGRAGGVKYFLANWKMFPTVDEAQALFDAVQAGLRERARSGRVLPEVILCPPFVSLAPLGAVADARLLRLGAQNCHWEQEGPYTGEISPRMLRGLVEYVMVGHSERRVAGETDEQIARKVAAIGAAGLVPILFVGEDEPGGDAIRQTEQRVREGTSRIDVASQDVVVVYEPTWAIGARQAASPEHVRGAVEHLKGVLSDLGARRPEVIYGGSVNDGNIDDLARLEILDGLGATRASLRPDTFFAIIDRASATLG
jgi:triosephosphate isomerase (TIM)